MAEPPQQWCDDVADELSAQITGVSRRKPSERRNRSVEVDLWVDLGSIRAVAAALEARGFFPLRSLREGTHRFFLARTPQGWCKIDAKTRPGQRRRIGNVLWSLRKRRGVIVALIGADGAGKSSAIEAIGASAPFGIHAAYLGTRRKRSQSAGTTEARPRPAIREVIGVGVWAIRTARKLLPVHKQARLGRVVICDRHPTEIQAVDGSPSRLARRMRQFIAGRLLPQPDFYFLLAAPGDVLYARKREHSPERLDAMTASFRTLVKKRAGTEIDATAPAAEVAVAIEDHLALLMADRM